MKIQQNEILKAYVAKLGELACARMGKSTALMAGVKANGFSIEDLRSAISAEIEELDFDDDGDEDSHNPMGPPYVADIIAPAHEQGEVWECIVSYCGELYCVQFKIDSDHEVEIVGKPEEVARSTDYEYVHEEENEAKAAAGEAALKAEDAVPVLQDCCFKAHYEDFKSHLEPIKSHSGVGDSHGKFLAHLQSAAAHAASYHAYHDGSAALHSRAQAMHASAAALHKVVDQSDHAEKHEGHAEEHAGFAEQKEDAAAGKRHAPAKGKIVAADFRGNQHKSSQAVAAEYTAAANVASREANRASKEAKDKGSHDIASARHATAQQMHEVAAEKHRAADNDDDADDHEMKAERHEKKAAYHKSAMEATQHGMETKDAKGQAGALAAKAGAGHIRLDCASKDSNKLRTILPTEEGVIMYMPAGIHTITPSQAGKPITVSVLVDANTAKVLESQRKVLTANGKKPFFSVQHATEIAAFWPTRFFWDKRVDATGSLVEGVWAEGEWTKTGKESVEGKDFRTFSPTFHVDAVRNDPENPSIVVDASEYAAANMGALENDPAFQEMSPLWCKDASTKAVKDVLAELKAGGKNPTLSDLRHGVFNKHKILLTNEEVAERLAATK